MFEESRAAESAAVPAELQQEVRRHNDDRAKLMLYDSGIGQTWSPANPGHQKTTNNM